MGIIIRGKTVIKCNTVIGHIVTPINYATFDPSNTSVFVLSGGNLVATAPFSTTSTRSTVSQSSGKWYWEYTLTNVSSGYETDMGITNAAASSVHYYGTPGFIIPEFISEPAGEITGNIISVVADFDNGHMYYYINGTVLPNSLPQIIPADTWFAFLSTNSGGVVITVNFGASPFTYYASIIGSLGFTPNPGLYS